MSDYTDNDDFDPFDLPPTTTGVDIMQADDALMERLCGENYNLQEEQDRIRTAIKVGMDIVCNDANTLTFDLDGEEALAVFRYRVKFLECKAFQPQVQITRSKSGNYHAKVTVTPTLTEPLCVAIQACLGSDWKREMLGVLRLLNKQPSVSLLFRPLPLEVVE